MKDQALLDKVAESGLRARQEGGKFEEAMKDAHLDGWSLRDIAKVAQLSHESVRRSLASDPELNRLLRSNQT